MYGGDEKVMNGEDGGVWVFGCLRGFFKWWSKLAMADESYQPKVVVKVGRAGSSSGMMMSTR